MTHEIRTPLNAVIGMNELLLATPLSLEQREYAEAIRQSSQALLTVLNDILDFSSINGGNLTLEPIPFDLAVTTQDIVAVFAKEAAAGIVEVSLHYPPGVPRRVIGDPGRIRQILLNLIGNAVKFTLHGHVLVEVESRETTAENVLLKISVTDTGIGIPPQRLPSLFQEFTQADATTTRKFGGTGLGLAICERLVKAMGGSMDVTSQEGVGSTFSFSICLPIHQASSAAYCRSELKNARILVVDDSEITRLLLSEQLNICHIRHSCVSSARLALRALRQGVAEGDPFHAAVIDLRAPDIDREQLGRAIQSDTGIPSIGLVLLTAAGQKGDGSRFERAGFSAYLTKPLRQDSLMDTLAAVCGSRELGSKLSGLITRHTLAEAKAAQMRADDVVPKQPARRFLVAEDNPLNQKLTLRMLEKWGFEADLAADGRECVERWSRSSYDAILMDYNMPELDGCEATVEIRRREASLGCGHTPIFALTASATPAERERCLQVGMDAFMSKPILADELRRALELVEEGLEEPARL